MTFSSNFERQLAMKSRWNRSEMKSEHRIVLSHTNIQKGNQAHSVLKTESMCTFSGIFIAETDRGYNY